MRNGIFEFLCHFSVPAQAKENINGSREVSRTSKNIGKSKFIGRSNAIVKLLTKRLFLTRKRQSALIVENGNTRSQFVVACFKHTTALLGLWCKPAHS